MEIAKKTFNICFKQVAVVKLNPEQNKQAQALKIKVVTLM